jgi:tetratricopeptide (TPR) repeat protein
VKTFVFFIFPIFIASFLFFNGPVYSDETTGNAKVYLDAGINLYNQERYFDAIDSFRNALEINPYYGDAYKYMALVYSALGEFQASLESAQNALKYANNDPDALLILADSYRELGQYDQSLAIYNQLVSNFPAYVEVYRNMAELYMKMNKLPLSLSMLEKADRINKNYWKNYISFGNYYLKTGNPGQAGEYFMKALSLNPTERLVYVTLADYYKSAGEYDQAISLLESGEKLFNNFYSGILLLADCYLEKAMITGKGYDKAIEKYLWIKDNGPQKDKHFRGGLFYKMGFAYENLDPSKAVDSYKESLAMEPGNQFVRAAFENFVINNFKVDAPERQDLSAYHMAAAKDDVRKGENRSYFLNLKRAITLYPLSSEPRETLVNYYEQRKNNYGAYQELKSLSKTDRGYRVQDKLENYDWKIRNNRIKLESPDYFYYKGLFLLRSGYFNLPKVYSDMVLYNCLYYGKFKFSTMDYRKDQGINTVMEYLRENDYSFFVTGDLDKSLSYLQFKLFDKNGKLIDSLSENYKMEDMNISVDRFLEWMDRILPAIWINGGESTPGVYYLSAGALDGLSGSDSLTAIDTGQGEIRPLSMLKIKTLRDYSSDISVVTNYKERNYGSLENKFIIKTMYLSPKYLTNLKRILGY